MALTCLMYAALSSSWSLFCGSHALPVAEHPVLRHRRHASALMLELPWWAAIALGAGRRRRSAMLMGAAVLHLRGTYFAC